MIQLSNLNKALFSIFLFFFSCVDDTINYVACSPNQILDSCGQCYYSDEDEIGIAALMNVGSNMERISVT